MKPKYLLITALVLIVSSCGLYKRIYSIVYNKFDEAPEPVTGEFKEWNTDDLFILRIKLVTDYTLQFQNEGIQRTEIADFPMKDYRLLTTPRWRDQGVVEEVYLYLDGFSTNGKIDGSVIYMSTMPLEPEPSKAMFCNGEYVNTYAINHLMTGHWSKNENDTVSIYLNEGKNELFMRGKFIQHATPGTDEMLTYIEIEDVSHPKPADDNPSYNTIRADDVMNVNPENDTTSEVLGLRFFGNSDRTFIHYEWDDAPDSFCYDIEMRRMKKYAKYNSVNAFRLGLKSDPYTLYLRLSDTAQTVLGYDR